jgi:hypothetical protein
VFGEEDAEEAAEAKHARKGFWAAEIVTSGAFACALEEGGEGCLEDGLEEVAHFTME